MDKRDRVWVIVFLVLGAIGLASYLRLYEEASPVASLDFKLDREEAFEKARDYTERLGYSTGDYESAQIFSWDYEHQVFLERTLGLPEANRLAREWVSIWAWQVRWYKPLVKEEFRIHLDPGGRIVNFVHRILETDPGASLTQTDALPIAETFLTVTQGFDLADYELIEESSVERPARMDHTFTYRKRDFTVGDDGHYRLKVIVLGDRVGEFSEFLKVPESFSRNYREIRSRAGLLTSFFRVFHIALMVAILFVLVQRHRQGTLRWRGPLLIGIVVAVASIIAGVNALPLAYFGFETTESQSFFVLEFLAVALLASIYSGGVICLTGVSGGSLARQVLYSNRRNPLQGISIRRVFSPGFARSTIVGYGLAFSSLGYVTLFYIFGIRYLGVWVPADLTEYNNSFSTLLPWIEPLLVGLRASTGEEFLYRLFAIPLLIRWLKRPWLAVLLQAIIWAFLHSNYPQEPIYIRGLEITVVGVVYGAIFLRFGIWATVISHYAFNAFVGAFPMLISSSLYFQVSGGLVVGILFLPVLPAIYGMITGRYRYIEEEEEEMAVAESVQEPPPEETPQIRREWTHYRPDKRAWQIAVLLAIASASILIGLEKTPWFGRRTLTLAVTRSDAVTEAESFLRDAGLQLAGGHQTTWFESVLGSDDYVHLVRKAGVARADSLASALTTPWQWRVRRFRPLEKEEVQIGVDPDGRVTRFEHLIPENQPGDALEIEDARSIAETFVVTKFNRTVTDSVRYKLLEAESEKREARVDHRFVWERIDRKVEEGQFRTEVIVQGNTIGLVSAHYKAPEAFLRGLQEKKAKDFVSEVLPIILIVVTIVLAGRSLMRGHKEGALTWGFPIRIGAVVVLLRLLDYLNDLPIFYRGYDTRLAMGTFVGHQLIGLFISLAFTGLAVTLMVALAQALYHRTWPGQMPPDRWLNLLRLRPGSARLLRDGLFLGLILYVVKSCLGRLDNFVTYHWLADYLKPDSIQPLEIDTFIPALGLTLDAVSSLLLIVFATLMVVLLWRDFLRRLWLFLALFMVVVLVVGAISSAEDLSHFAVLAGLSLIRWAALLFLILRVVKWNLLAYAIAFWLNALIPHGLSLLDEANSFYQGNGIAVLVVGVIPMIMTVIAHLKDRRVAPSVGTTQ